ncbi:hypothetical protein BH10ACT11_BH10ACT11_15980 [soil metagenome]
MVKIEVRGRNLEVTDEMERAVRKRFARLSKQVSPLATLDVEIFEEPNPRIANRHVVEATIHVKGKTLRASEATPELVHSIHAAAEDIRRQVKRDRDMRRSRTEARRFSANLRNSPAGPVDFPRP